jgi:prevent-host-death family protein
MTMGQKIDRDPIRHVPAGEFKAKCLALLDEVDATGETLIITKRGRPVAKLVPAHDRQPRSLLGSVLRESDLVAPTGEAWDAER